MTINIMMKTTVKMNTTMMTIMMPEMEANIKIMNTKMMRKNIMIMIKMMGNMTMITAHYILKQSMILFTYLMIQSLSKLCPSMEIKPSRGGREEQWERVEAKIKQKV